MQVGTAGFRFPALDPATEAFLWRRKADLEAAIEAMPATATTSAAASAPQNAPGRASADLADAKALAGVGATKTANVGKCAEPAEEPPSSSSKSATREKTGKGNNGSGKGRAGKRALGKGERGKGSLGAAAATALLAASNGSSAISGARGLQLAMIKGAFSRLDVDGDGYITPGDLGLAFRNMGRDASDRRWVLEMILRAAEAPCLRRRTASSRVRLVEVVIVVVMVVMVLVGVVFGGGVGGDVGGVGVIDSGVGGVGSVGGVGGGGGGSSVYS